MPSAVVLAVCVVARWRSTATNDHGRTGIDKRPLSGPVEVGALGVAGDGVGDLTHHGGPDKAVYAYADEDASVWSAALGRDVSPGLFGENLRTRGLAVTDAVLGERWQVGQPGTGPLLEVCQPRIPCRTFAERLGEDRWVRRFTEAGAPGAYLRVLQPGTATAGEPVEVVHRPAHGITVGEWFSAPSPELAVRLLAAQDAGDVRLGADLQHYVDRQARHAAPTT